MYKEGYFLEKFIETSERLDMFFHRQIVKSNIRVDIEQTKKDLLQETAFCVLKKLQKETYHDYNLVALIWLKAVDVWCDYIKAFKRSMELLTTIARLSLQSDAECDPFLVMDRNELLSSMRGHVGEYRWNMVLLHAEGYTYKQIADQLCVSEASVRQAVWRWMHKLRKGNEDDAE